jgi:hypothetical protein
LLVQGFTTTIPLLVAQQNTHTSTNMLSSLGSSGMSLGNMFFSTKSLLCLGLLSSTVAAHTWIEQMQVIGTNGSYVGDYGYPRGYVSRTDAGFDGFSNKWQLPSPDTDTSRTRITDKMLACHPNQRTPNYSQQYPKLSVAPGAYVAMKYLENGHVTQPFIPAGKPEGSGTVWIYGTYEPNDAETLVNVLSWTADGKGGNGKGFLMAAQNYDDGRCYQINQSPTSVNRQMTDGNHAPGQPTSQLEQWCESNVLVPSNSQVGKTLTVYWVWGWATGMQTEGAMCGKDEYYTTCSDFDIVNGGDELSKIIAAPKVHTIGQQDPQTIAVSNYQSRTAHAPTPTIITTQECTFTSATTSSVPASLSEKTTLPAGFSTSIARPPMPKYRLGGKPAAANSTLPASSEASSTAPLYSNTTISATASATASSAVTTASPSSQQQPSATSPDAAPEATVTASSTTTAGPTIIYKTITIPASSPLAAPSSSNPNAPAASVVANGSGVVGLSGKRAVAFAA